MIAKSLVAGMLGTTLLATAAFAQTTAPADSNSSMSKSPAASSTVSPATHTGQWRSSKLIGVNVYDQNNEKLGDISELLLDSSGKVQAAVIGVGGFLGVGQRDVAIPFEQLKFSNQPVSGNTAMNNSTNSKSTTNTGMTTGAASSSSSSSTADRWYPDHAVLNTTKDQLKAMPEFSYSGSSSTSK
ncbi:PRC-barrel domain-containing protein [Rhodopseudomonas sp. B29]|uniref:PRC-barrel domain-containing protein n=1 Tax=Rhodopseudomonas sp. B29 TaxID=95607 RepID=UPI00034BFD68|nr:PRC-barrel domain-containing protein [Rhodopseudomonas sp. B29]